MAKPTKYNPKMCKKVIELMSEGASLCEVAAELGICKDEIDEWKEQVPEFSEAIKKGNDAINITPPGKGEKNEKIISL